MRVVAGILILSTILSFTSGFAADEGQGQTPNAQKRYNRAVADLAEKLNNDIEFYGRVVDLDGGPVGGATVKVSVRVAGALPSEEFKRLEVVAGSDGAFSVDTYGDVLGVDEIVRDGYLYHYKYTPERNFKSLKKENRHSQGFEPDNPMVFRVRKLAPPAFVVIHNMTFAKKPGKASVFDLVKRRWVHDEQRLLAFQYSSFDRDWHTDIRLSVEGEPGNLRLVLETPDDDSGFVVEQHEFFDVMTEAPAHGYRRRVEVPVSAKDSALTAYVKAQGGLCYARIQVLCAERRPGMVDVNATSFTNFAGGRNLEYTPWVESQYDWDVNIDHIRKEIRRADLLSGRPIELPQRRK